MTVTAVCTAIDMRPRAHGELVVTPGIALYEGDYTGHQCLSSKFDDLAPGSSSFLETLRDELFDNCPTVKYISISKIRFQITYSTHPEDRRQIEEIIREILG